MLHTKSPWTLRYVTVYITYQEIAGHMGKRLYPTSSFVQCIWIPRFLGIELYVEEDHDLHLAKFVVNYSKRFNLFDRLFGTYESGITNENTRRLHNSSKIKPNQMTKPMKLDTTITTRQRDNLPISHV